MKRYKKIVKASSRIGERNKIKKYASRLLKVAVVVAIILGPIFVLRANFLQIKNIEVVGGEATLRDNINDTAYSFVRGNKFLFIPKSNILLLDEKDLAFALSSQFTRIESVEVNKKLDKTVEISIKERASDFLWCRGEECFHMSKEGLVFSVFDESDDSLRAGKIIFRGGIEGDPIMKSFAIPEKMQDYLKMIETLKSFRLEVSALNIESVEKMVVDTNIGNIFLNPRDLDLSLSVQNAVTLIEEVKSKNPTAHFNYIDARFGNKVFYKLY